MTHAHTEDELRRAEHYIVRAKEIAARGFYTKADKKDANGYLANAYDTLVKYGFNYIVWNSRIEKDGRWVYPNKAWEKLDYGNFPDLHIWAKNPAKYTKIYADFPEVVKRGNELGALRTAIDAAELVAKPKSKTAVQREERAADAKTCQICGRPILAETGVIAHHGYQRPELGSGWQTASCSGARELPFEVSRDVLGKHIKRQQERAIAMRANKLEVKQEKIMLGFSYWNGKYDTRHKCVIVSVIVNRALFPSRKAEHALLAKWASDLPLSYDWLKDQQLQKISHEIKAQDKYIKYQQARYDGWKAVA